MNGIKHCLSDLIRAMDLTSITLQAPKSWLVLFLMPFVALGLRNFRWQRTVRSFRESEAVSPVCNQAGLIQAAA